MTIAPSGRFTKDRWLTLALTLSIGYFSYTAYDRWLAPADAANKSVGPLPQEPISLHGAVLRGSPSAPVALLVYTDFLCPACGKFAKETLPKLIADQVDSGKLLLAVRFLSDGGARPLAYKVAQAGECSAQQNLFWPTHDELFKKGQVLADDKLPPQRVDEMLFEVAKQVGLSEQPFRECLGSQTVRLDVFEDAGGGLFLGVRATPTLFIGRLKEGLMLEVTTKEEGAVPLDALVSMLTTASLPSVFVKPNR